MIFEFEHDEFRPRLPKTTAWEELIDLARKSDPEAILQIVSDQLQRAETPSEKGQQTTITDDGEIATEGNRIKSVEQLKQEIGFQDTKYHIYDSQVKTWEVHARNKARTAWIRATNFGVTIKYRLRGLEKPGTAFSDQWLDDLTKDVQLPSYEVKDLDTKPIVVAFGDLHLGGIYEGNDLVPKLNLEVLQERIMNIAAMVNAMFPNRPVHYIVGGDLIESFTGKNHKDTWKKIEKHGAEVSLTAFDILYNLFTKTENFQKAYLISGNHDRMTDSKDDDPDGQLCYLIKGMFDRITDIDVEYDPKVVYPIIDGVCYIGFHGDKNFSKKNGASLTLDYGHQDLFNVIIGFHKHQREIFEDDLRHRKVTCPSIVTPNHFADTMGFHSRPGFMAFESSPGGVFHHIYDLE